MPIDEQIKQLEWELKEAKRKQRKDFGIKRASYNSNLPKNYVAYIRGANSRGLKFNLTIEEFNNIKSFDCVYCGTSSKIGIDRIDSSLDYNIDNVQPCCFTYNVMKRDSSHEDFIKHIFKIVNKISTTL